MVANGYQCFFSEIDSLLQRKGAERRPGPGLARGSFCLFVYYISNYETTLSFFSAYIMFEKEPCFSFYFLL